MAKEKKPPKPPEEELLAISGFSYVEDNRGIKFRMKLDTEIRRLCIEGCSVLHIDACRPCSNYDRWTAFIYYSQTII